MSYPARAEGLVNSTHTFRRTHIQTHTHAHTHTHTHTHIYIYIYIYIYISSLSLWSHAASTDFLNNLLSFAPFIHRSGMSSRQRPVSVHRCFRKVLVGRQTLLGLCEAVHMRKSLMSSFFVSPAVSILPCSSYLDGFRNWRQLAIPLMFCVMLLPGFVQYSS